MEHSHFHVRKGVVDDETTGFLAVTFAPRTSAQPQAELPGQPDETQQLAVINCPDSQIVFPKAQYPVSGIMDGKGTRRPKKIAQQQWIVGDPRQRWRVRYLERSENETV
nr:hypothetical protein [Agrobacterium rosae]